MTADRPRGGRHVDPAGTDGSTAAQVLRYPTRSRVVGRRAYPGILLVLVAVRVLHVDAPGPTVLGMASAIFSLALCVLLTVGNWTWAGRPSVTACPSPGTDHTSRAHRPRPVVDADAAYALTRAADNRSQARHTACLAMLVSAQTHDLLIDHTDTPVVAGICAAFSVAVAALAVVELVRHRRLEVAAGHVLPDRERSAPCI